MKCLADNVNEELDYNPVDEVVTYQNDHIVIFKPNRTLKKEVEFSFYHFIIPEAPLPP